MLEYKGTWEMVEDICDRYNLSYNNVRSEIRAMRDDAVDLSLQEVTMLQHGEGNLCECWVVGEIPRHWH